MTERVFHFRPIDIGRWIVWGGYALILLLAPLVFNSSLSQTLLSQMGIAIIACLSYNMLLGQGGMLSFGHAVYSGLGGFLAIHALNKVGDGSLHLPVSLVPMVGGLAGLVFAALFGFVTTRKSGTTFAMITLGIGELVYSMSLMLPEFFGGEAGINSNRVVPPATLGVTFGPQIQVYYLIALYCFVCTGLMFAFTRTPLGRMLNAVRDNPERVAFIGYDTQRVRWLAFMISGLFAGIAGGLAAINFELATAEVVGAQRSGAYLLFTFLGGSTAFFGPIIGGVLMVLATVVLSNITKAWLLYLGLAFMLMVMYAPSGVAGLVLANLRLAAFGRLRPLLSGYLALFVAGAIAFTGASAMVEMLYHLQLNEALGPVMTFGGVSLNAKGAGAWVGAALLFVAGAIAFELARRRFRVRWDAAQHDIERELKRREAA
ncbi:branched-chain amino acid ABC transporter permease [Scleromatobacter humisilvae]|uniref:Branched-chain amino acid ABC transporter permease n=1 Tax=Scleromatobacter humisilvae TaxID=2897159 RepID=A0A9X1YKJ8_9BURK|nr:branched-chain amino acid ABC transporter permease [Scleromatobacter humisilvae]MCK9687432.1 branched-chain amino acid ABC transporter permease [Scleromatobacter humisilvae]